MKKLVFILTCLPLLFISCSTEDDCKICGTWYTIDPNLTEAEAMVIYDAGLDELMQMSENLNMEYCGNALDLQEQAIDNMGSAASTQMQGYMATIECR